MSPLVFRLLHLSFLSCEVGITWYNIMDCAIQFILAGEHLKSWKKAVYRSHRLAFNIFRIWAIWDRDRKILLFVLPFAILTPAVNVVSTVHPNLDCDELSTVSRRCYNSISPVVHAL